MKSFPVPKKLLPLTDRVFVRQYFPKAFCEGNGDTRQVVTPMPFGEVTVLGQGYKDSIAWSEAVRSIRFNIMRRIGRRTQNAAQKLAGQRNWDQAQLSGIRARLKYYCSNLGAEASHAAAAERLLAGLMKRVDIKWKADKERLTSYAELTGADIKDSK